VIPLAIIKGKGSNEAEVPSGFSIQDEDGFAKIGADTTERTQPRSG
jgi:hypothetical protein